MKSEEHCCTCCMAEDAVTLATIAQDRDCEELTDAQKALRDLAARFLTRRYTEALLPKATQDWPAPSFTQPPPSSEIRGTCDT